ncbi:MAG: leucine-rich repeat protein [Spirochaetaceae bacterium]|jgi:outer membrane protein OmpA-like peptidoglycan-associated protein|nr:leucine-rich repeat protein [Spirochaetaceae bacterium]
MKRCLVMVFCVTTSVLLWAQSEDDFQVLQKSENMLTITGYTGRLSQIVIPANIYGQTVNEIGSNSFTGNKLLTSVVIPDTVSVIGNYAFSGCSNLSAVEFGNSLLSIGDSAFSGCALSVPGLPEGLVSIGNSAFAENKLKAVSLPDSVTRIGVGAFARNPELGEVLLGSGIESVFFNALGSEENDIGIIAVRKSGVALGSIGLDQNFVNTYNTGGAGVYVKRGSLWIKETSDPVVFVLPTISLRGGTDKVPPPGTVKTAPQLAKQETTVTTAPMWQNTPPNPPPQPVSNKNYESAEPPRQAPPPPRPAPPPPRRAQDFLGARWTIYFPGNGASFDGLRRDLTASNRKNMEELSDILKEFPSLKVRITGYTNPMRPTSREIRRVLQPLSEQRAEAAARLLNFYGISRGRMVVRGAGASEPLASYARRADWHLNRRAEIVIFR